MSGVNIFQISCFIVGIVLMIPFMMKEYLFVAGYVLVSLAVA